MTTFVSVLLVCWLLFVAGCYIAAGIDTVKGWFRSRYGHRG